MTKVVVVDGKYLAILGEMNKVETKELPEGLVLNTMSEVEYDNATGEIRVDGVLV